MGSAASKVRTIHIQEYDQPRKGNNTSSRHSFHNRVSNNKLQSSLTGPTGISASHILKDYPTGDLKLFNSRTDVLFNHIKDNVIGKDFTFLGPFGLTKAIYCDFTASGKSLVFIEDFIRENILPGYANTHTSTTATGAQTTNYRNVAREVIRRSVNGGDDDAVIFTGSGCTAAVHKLIHALNFTQPPIVFVGPYEHHSNILPWKEINSDVIRIPHDKNGLVDKRYLEHELKKWKARGRQMVGSFSCASNVTGIMADVDDISVLLHTHGALAFFDYATSAPYIKIDMNPGENNKYNYKDAVFISVHKFVGGPQTPGVLVAKKKLFQNRVPHNCGGGTVAFVRREAHRYLENVEDREEGGTPAIVESIRAGLVFYLKDLITHEAILERDHLLMRRALKKWSSVSNSLVILGNVNVPRLPIFSFLVKHQDSGLFLHHNFVCAVLNDVFGIQARGGCACAGPYADDLLGISEDLAKRMSDDFMDNEVIRDVEFIDADKDAIFHSYMKPGFARLNLPFYEDDKTIDYILEAVRLTAKYAWMLLPQYACDLYKGKWQHRNQYEKFNNKDHENTKNVNIVVEAKQVRRYDLEPQPKSYQEYLDRAKQIFSTCKQYEVKLPDQTIMFDSESADLRWFLLPSEAHEWLHHPRTAADRGHHNPPFDPPLNPLPRATKNKH